MTPNLIIYFINQSPELIKAWRELTESQKREVVKACERANESDIERIIKEVIDGQRRCLKKNEKFMLREDRRELLISLRLGYRGAYDLAQEAKIKRAKGAQPVIDLASL